MSVSWLILVTVKVIPKMFVFVVWTWARSGSVFLDLHILIRDQFDSDNRSFTSSCPPSHLTGARTHTAPLFPQGHQEELRAPVPPSSSTLWPLPLPSPKEDPLSRGGVQRSAQTQVLQVLRRGQEVTPTSCGCRRAQEVLLVIGVVQVVTDGDRERAGQGAAGGVEVLGTLR